MKDLNHMTEIPVTMKPFYATLPEFLAEFKLFLENSRRNDELMAKMFDKLSTAEAEAVREEIAQIATKMNSLMVERFKRQDKLLTVMGIMSVADLMTEYAKPSVLTKEQFDLLNSTGAFNELLTAKKTSI